jgi:phage terminase large subunit GpA-like protein
MSAYSDKLKSPKWQKKRLQILNRDRFTCKLCKDTETTLHVHHKYYVDNCEPWEYPNTALVTLCEHCHKVVEDQKDEIEEFEEVKIIKSDNWTTGKRIMYLANSRTGLTSMEIYGKDDQFIVGFNLTISLQTELIKLFKYALK